MQDTPEPLVNAEQDNVFVTEKSARLIVLIEFVRTCVPVPRLRVNW